MRITLDFEDDVLAAVKELARRQGTSAGQVVSRLLRVAQVAERLEEACNHASHVFWPAQISLLIKGLIRWERMLDPRQITDSYLLALAVVHGGRFVSFDQRIRVDLVPNASQTHLAIIELPNGQPGS